ncbi:MAG TPA: hypothetical protein VGP36_10725 [Mycobacteriales bacterium]|nr:hypothetical protein [Mycobacteriales bacterium]
MTNLPDPATVEALGKISEALETVERARGHLYSFHQLSGTADAQLQDGVRGLREAGHDYLADEIEAGLVGRNVLPDRWTFQIVEEYDDGYWSVFREYENRARQSLAGGRRHLFEAGMKQDERAGKNPEAITRPPR